jgi:LEA14-like dessication related protein
MHLGVEMQGIKPSDNDDQSPRTLGNQSNHPIIFKLNMRLSNVTNYVKPTLTSFTSNSSIAFLKLPGNEGAALFIALSMHA